MLVLTRYPNQQIVIGPIGAPTFTIELTSVAPFRCGIEVNGRPRELRMGETFAIADGVAFRLLGVNGRQVRVGVLAPKDVPIHRSEVAARIYSEQFDGAAMPARALMLLVCVCSLIGMLP